MTARRLRIRGVVQGVGFRAWTVRTATRLGLSGWVRNRPDGSVEAWAEGDPAALEELVRACHRGPPGASVTAVEQDQAAPEGHAGFVQRPTA